MDRICEIFHIGCNRSSPKVPLTGAHGPWFSRFTHSEWSRSAKALMNRPMNRHATVREISYGFQLHGCEIHAVECHTTNHRVARRHTIRYPHATETIGTMTDTAR